MCGLGFSGQGAGLWLVGVGLCSFCESLETVYDGFVAELLADVGFSGVLAVVIVIVIIIRYILAIYLDRGDCIQGY